MAAYQNRSPYQNRAVQWAGPYCLAANKALNRAAARFSSSVTGGGRSVKTMKPYKNTD